MKHLHIIILASLLLVSACNKKTKSYLEGKKYIDLMQQEFRATADSSMIGIEVNVQPAKKNSKWLNSNFNSNVVPENIKVAKLNPNKQKSYSVYRDDNIFGSNYTPVFSDGIMYIVDNKSTIHAFDVTKTFKSKWRKNLLNKYQTDLFAGGGIAKYKDILIVTFGSNSVVALKAGSGELVWQYKLSNVSRASPIIKDSSAYITTIDNRIYCFDIYSGIPKWQISGAVEKIGIFGSATPAVTNDVVLTPQSSGQLIAIKQDSGQVIWDLSLIKSQQNSTTTYFNDIDMSPIISNNVAYVGNYTGALFAVDIPSGQVKWVNETIGGSKFAWQTEDFIFIVNKHSQFLAVYKIDGAVKWILDLEPYEKKNSKKSKQIGDFTIYSGPTMVNGKLYLTSSEGKLFEVDPKTGNLFKQYKIPVDIYTPVIPVGDKLYLFNNNGTLTIIN